MSPSPAAALREALCLWSRVQNSFGGRKKKKRSKKDKVRQGQLKADSGGGEGADREGRQSAIALLVDRGSAEPDAGSHYCRVLSPSKGHVELSILTQTFQKTLISTSARPKGLR